MAWWMDIVIVFLIVLGIYGLMTLTGAETRLLTRKTTRRAEDMYSDFADKPTRRRFRR